MEQINVVLFGLRIRQKNREGVAKVSATQTSRREHAGRSHTSELLYDQSEAYLEYHWRKRAHVFEGGGICASFIVCCARSHKLDRCCSPTSWEKTISKQILCLEQLSAWS